MNNNPFAAPPPERGENSGQAGERFFGQIQSPPQPLIALVLMMVVATIAVKLAPGEIAERVIIEFAVLTRYGGQFDLAQIYKVFTGTFIHLNWLQLAFHALVIIGLGNIFYRVLGLGRFLLYFFACAAAGDLATLLNAQSEVVLLTGASAGVYGLLAAFGHATMAPFFLPPRQRWERLLGFSAVILAINLFFAFGSPTAVGTEITRTGWITNLGGFFAGLILFPWIIPTRKEPDQA